VQERVVETAAPIDVARSFQPLWRGAADPTMRRDGEGWVRASRLAAGLATFRVTAVARGVRVQAWGPAATEILEHAEQLVGATDSLEGFAPTGLVADLARRAPGLRMVATRTVFQNLLLAVLEQKVPGKDAFASFRGAVRELGEAAPGPFELRATPAPQVLATLPAFRWRELGVDEKRQHAITFAARRADRLEALAVGSPREARRYLLAMPGIGPWTAAEVVRTALGDPDCVTLGDYHLPSVVSFNLAGEPRGDDERMVQLLAPFVGHRARVVALLAALGEPAPRYGPRMTLRPFTAGAIRATREPSSSADGARPRGPRGRS
jgi:3-methyladenine DNA glycosylase/8-oxoguanine DNA glycosylase